MTKRKTPLAPGEAPRRSPGHWHDFENVKTALQEVVEDLGGVFPLARDLQHRGLQGLASAIGKHHGGFLAVRERMGYDLPTKPFHHWKQWGHVEAVLLPVINELGTFPTSRQLHDRGLTTVVRAIEKYHGGINATRARLGFDLQAKPRGYWQNWDNAELALIEVVDELGQFPTLEQLADRGLSGLANALLKDHGGLSNASRKLGMELGRKPKGYWLKWENVKRELRRVMRENGGTFPTPRVLVDMKLSSLMSAIIEHHGGFPSVRQRLVGFSLLDQKIWSQYAAQITKAYMREAKGESTLEEFVIMLDELCESEEDLRMLLIAP